VAKRNTAKAETLPSLSEAAVSAVGVMGLVVLDAEVANEHRVDLDAAAKTLWSAVRSSQGFARMTLAVPKGMTISLEPIEATCATCGDRALIIPTPPPDTTGLAICRTCSFPKRRQG
jgi:hypothetical protein